eukprot:scaffold134116_cov105-Phaeocystis_antarctica.AAC.1
MPGAVAAAPAAKALPRQGWGWRGPRWPRKRRAAAAPPRPSSLLRLPPPPPRRPPPRRPPPRRPRPRRRGATLARARPASLPPRPRCRA